MKKILYVTNLDYLAEGRNYPEEDIKISSLLRPLFHVSLVHPSQAVHYLDVSDIVLFRNTGPLSNYHEDFIRFLQEVKRREIPIYNAMDGKADIRGKQYLVDLTKTGFPVIPTVDRPEDINKLGPTERYLVKPKHGADSIGLEHVGQDGLETIPWGERILQPFVDFEHEISFYFIDNRFQYALYAPDIDKRWDLEEANISSSDLSFAQRFVDWNGMSHGITRVDACRLRDGSLLLMELEDLNPYLSLDRLSGTIQGKFITKLLSSIKALI